MAFGSTVLSCVNTACATPPSVICNVWVPTAVRTKAIVVPRSFWIVAEITGFAVPDCEAVKLSRSINPAKLRKSATVIIDVVGLLPGVLINISLSVTAMLVCVGKVLVFWFDILLSFKGQNVFCPYG